jgi:hypothetical protein
VLYTAQGWGQLKIKNAKLKIGDYHAKDTKIMGAQ